MLSEVKNYFLKEIIKLYGVVSVWEVNIGNFVLAIFNTIMCFRVKNIKAMGLFHGVFIML